MQIDLEHAEFINDYRAEENVKCFVHDRILYKGVLPGATSFHHSELFDTVLNRLMKDALIPETIKTNMYAPGFGALYTQRKDYFFVPPYRFPVEMIKDAALTFLSINSILLDYNLCTIDGHMANFVSQGASLAKWCDIGSFVPLGQSQDTALQQFIESVVFWLLLIEKLNTSTWLMRSCKTSMDIASAKYFRLLEDDFAKMNGHKISNSIAKRMRFIKYDIFKKQSFWNSIIANYDEKHGWIAFRGTRREMLANLKEGISNLKFAFPQTLWSDYENPLTEADGGGTRQRVGIFDKLLEELRPKTVVDVGANSGFFTRRALKVASEALAIECDEAALSAHYRFLRHSNFTGSIKLLAGKFGEFADGSAELVLVLALTHHLFLSQYWSWSLIAKTLAAYTSKHAITEYMPFGLSITTKPDNLPEGYTLTCFLDALAVYFETVEPVVYDKRDGPTRIFIVCKNKK